MQLRRVAIAAVIVVLAAGVLAPGAARAAPAVQTTVTYEDVPVGEVPGTPQVSYGTPRVVTVSEQVIARDARIEKLPDGRVSVTPVLTYAVNKVQEVPVTARTPYYQVYDRFRVTQEYRPGYWDTRTVTETRYRQVQETVFLGYRTEYYQVPVTRYETRYRAVQVPYAYTEYVPVTRVRYETRYRTEVRYRTETYTERVRREYTYYVEELVPVTRYRWVEKTTYLWEGPDPYGRYRWVPVKRLVPEPYTVWERVRYPKTVVWYETVTRTRQVPYTVQVPYQVAVEYTEWVPVTRTGYRTVYEPYQVAVTVYETRSRQVPVYETVTRLEPYTVTRTESYWVPEWSRTTREKVGQWTASTPHRWAEATSVQRTPLSGTETRQGAPVVYRGVVAITR